MSEEDWLKCDQVPTMLAFLGERASQRKLRLYSSAICRLHERLILDETLPFVEFLEQLAEGMGARSDTLLLWNERRTLLTRNLDRATFNAVRDVLFPITVTPAAVSYLEQRIWLECDFEAGEGNRLLADCLRDVFGTPFRPVTVEAGWRTADVVALAQAAYDERQMPTGRFDPVRVSILADALEDAGCAKELVGHLRGEGPHVRGCWVADLLLDKS